MKARMTKLMRGSLVAGLVSAMTLGVAQLGAQGMPPEARANIQTLFNNHEKITRKVEKTEKGYVATTESDDPKVVAAMRDHVKQMSARLESGMMVRRWDPAFAEYVAHYKDIKHKFTKTKKGVQMTVTGKTPEAVKVAQNHAAVVSEFIKDGWKAHDRTHPVALTQPAASSAASSSNCCAKAAAGACCAQRGGK